MGGDSGRVERGLDVVDDLRERGVPGGDVDRDPQSRPSVSSPARCQAASWVAASSSAQRPRSQISVEASAAGMNDVWGEQSMAGTVPAHQGLERDDLAGRQVDDRLVVEPELPVGEPGGDGGLQRAACRQRVLIGDDPVPCPSVLASYSASSARPSRTGDLISSSSGCQVAVPTETLRFQSGRLAQADAADGLHQPSSDDGRPAAIGAGEDDRELLAAVAGDEVPLASSAAVSARATAISAWSPIR